MGKGLVLISYMYTMGEATKSIWKAATSSVGSVRVDGTDSSRVPYLGEEGLARR